MEIGDPLRRIPTNSILIGTILHRWKRWQEIIFLQGSDKKNSEIPTLLSQGTGATFSDHCTRIIHKRGIIIPICKDYCLPTNGPSITFQTCFAWTMLTPVNYTCVALLRQKKCSIHVILFVGQTFSTFKSQPISQFVWSSNNNNKVMGSKRLCG